MKHAVRCLLLALLALTPLHAADGEPLTVYSGRAEALVGPLLERFTERTGIRVRTSYQGTAALATQIVAEGRACPADVFLAQDVGYLALLERRGLLQPLDTDRLPPVHPGFLAADDGWVGTSARARVLVYSPSRISGDALPSTLAGLADSKWRGRIGWAPGNASFQAHVSVLRHLWGDARTEEWLRSMIALSPVNYPKNSPQVRAVASGEIDVGWVNHYYLHKLRGQVGERAENYSFTAAGDAGNIVMPSGAGILANSPRSERAMKLVTFLLSDEAQRYFAQEVYEYPARPTIATHPDVPPIETLNLAAIDPAYLIDLEPTLVLLRKLGLL